jgi:outer membrane protein TolC
VGGTVPAYNRSIIPVLQPDGTTAFRTQQQTDASLTATLTQRLPLTGGDLFVSSSLARLEVNGDQAFRTWSSTPVVVGVRQPLFRPNALAWDRREQSVGAELAERTYVEGMEDVSLQTVNAFFDFYAARLGFDNAEKNAAINDTLYRLNSGRFEVGRIGENDLLQSELALLRSRAARETARLTSARATEALRLLLDLPATVPIVVDVTRELPTFEPDTARAVAEALRNVSAVSRLTLDDVQSRRRVTEARLATGMGATVQASYGLNTTASDVDFAYRDLRNAQRFTLSVQLPLWDWGAHGENVDAAEAERDRTIRLSEATAEQIAHEARFAMLEVVQAREHALLAARADSVAAKRFEVAYNRYVIGRIASDNLYVAQQEKDQALIGYVEALRGYWVAYYRLRRVTLFDFATGQTIRPR